MENLTELQQLGRAKNALSSFFDKHLIVPKIYIDADWGGKHLDVLAIDRAGVGDAHAVRLVLRSLMHEDGKNDVATTRAIIGTNDEIQQLKELKEMFETPCQYRYVAEVNISPKPREFERSEKAKANTFAEDGIGRIGIFEIDMLAEIPNVKEVIRAERFRSTKEILELTDKLVVNRTPDAEYRDPIYEQEVSA